MTTTAPAASDSNLADSQALTLRAAQTVANSIIQLQDQAFMIAGAYEVAGNTTVNCANATAHSRPAPWQPCLFRRISAAKAARDLLREHVTAAARIKKTPPAPPAAY